MITIYHNPRCSKSRECHTLLIDTKGHETEVINYMLDLFTEKTLKNLIGLLNIEPIQLVRKNESIWKSDFKGKEMTPTEVIEAMVAYPKLIQRPIVVNGDKAVVARPLELIESIL